MTELTLQRLVELGLATEVVGDGRVRVHGVRHDSRAVAPGDLFVALGGQVFDGHDFTADAVRRGAVAVAATARKEPAGVPLLLVDDGLSALAALSRVLYGDPTASIPVVGITGTNGKTTVAYLVEQALWALGERPAISGTICVRGPGGERPATHTTPMADDMMRLCRWAVDTGASHLVTEVSSHGLAMRRVDGVSFEVAAFTNLTQDHLDFHGDLPRYAAAKERLFAELSPRVAVINLDDAHGGRFAARFAGELLGYSRIGRAAAVRAVSTACDRHGIRATVEVPGGTVDLGSPLLGEHNLENLLCALGIGLALGFSAARVADALSGARGAPGRLQRVPHPGDVLVFVDYAHTPDALTRACTVLRTQTAGRLIVVFGCGGDRDRKKRPLMGGAVAAVADIPVLTSDNPRGESPQRILDDIVPGVRAAGIERIDAGAVRNAERGYVIEPDRARAIALTLRAARPGDTVLVAGKGHERVQVVGEQRLPFDDVEVAARAIAALGEAP